MMYLNLVVLPTATGKNPVHVGVEKEVREGFVLNSNYNHAPYRLFVD